MIAMDLSETTIDRMFGGFLRTQRNYARLSMAQIENKTGIPRHRVKALEKGNAARAVTVKECKALAKVLQVSAKRLLGNAEGRIHDDH